MQPITLPRRNNFKYRQLDVKGRRQFRAYYNRLLHTIFYYQDAKDTALKQRNVELAAELDVKIKEMQVEARRIDGNINALFTKS